MAAPNTPYSQKLVGFWHNALNRAANGRLRIKDLNLPLARIKRLMKVEEDVRMVASEVPVLFSLVAEVFVEELTMRAWMNTEESRRRILQKSDISTAIKTSIMYDFLIYVVPPPNYSLSAHESDIPTHQVFLEPQNNHMKYK